MPTRPRFPQCGARCRGAESGVVSVWESRGRLGVERCWWRIAPEAHGGAAEKGSTRQSSGVSPVSGGGGGEHLDMSSSKSERPCRKRMSPFVRLFGMCVCYGVVQTPVRASCAISARACAKLRLCRRMVGYAPSEPGQPVTCRPCRTAATKRSSARTAEHLLLPRRSICIADGFPCGPWSTFSSLSCRSSSTTQDDS